MSRFLFRALAVWSGILAAAVVNGVIRESLLIPLLGTLSGLVLSGLLLSLVIFVVSLLAIRWIGVATARQALSIGLLWLVATLAFEFGLGAGLQHKTMAELLAAYTFEGGNLWPLVLLVTALSPLAAHRLRNR